MTAYRYRALNADGKLVKGFIEGDSERQVRGQLRSQSLRPVEVAEANRSAANTAAASVDATTDPSSNAVVPSTSNASHATNATTPAVIHSRSRPGFGSLFRTAF